MIIIWFHHFQQWKNGNFNHHDDGKEKTTKFVIEKNDFSWYFFLDNTGERLNWKHQKKKRKQNENNRKKQKQKKQQKKIQKLKTTVNQHNWWLQNKKSRNIGLGECETKTRKIELITRQFLHLKISTEKNIHNVMVTTIIIVWYRKNKKKIEKKPLNP